MRGHSPHFLLVEDYENMAVLSVICKENQFVELNSVRRIHRSPNSCCFYTRQEHTMLCKETDTSRSSFIKGIIVFPRFWSQLWGRKPRHVVSYIV